MDQYPEVSLKLGRVMGRRSWTVNGSKYYYFKGIPYGKPPIEKLRFLDPKPADPWDGVRDCTFERGVCPQPAYDASPRMPRSIADLISIMRCIPALVRLGRKRFIDQTEDCLFVNVYTPQIPFEKVETPNLPVLFWIHGGAFLLGDGNEDLNGFDFYLERGVVVVSVNYRLGLFGFLSVGTESAPGNAGLKDQALALRWVRDNITAFGGDPNRVTLFGVSSGAASAHLHTLSPLSRGLFHGVVASSGSALNDWAVTPDGVKRAMEFGKVLGIDTKSPDSLVDTLKEMPAWKLIEGLREYVLTFKDSCLGVVIQFVPVVEHSRQGAFLAENPELILREGRQAQVPIIFGVNNLEGIVWLLGLENTKVGINKVCQLEEDMETLNRMPEQLVPADVSRALSIQQRQEMGKSAIEFFCGKNGICLQKTPEFIELLGDLSFVLRILTAVQQHAATCQAPVYMYRFTLDGRLGMSKYFLKNFEYKGVAHGDEISYLLNVRIPPSPAIDEGDPEWDVRRHIVGTLVNFIKTGNPNPSPGRSGSRTFSWSPTSSNLDYLEFNTACVMKKDMFTARYEFWNKLYEKYMKKPMFLDYSGS